MPGGKKTNLESLITGEELEQLMGIRREKIPQQIDQLGEGATGEVFLYKLENGSFQAGKQPRISLYNKSIEEQEQIKKHLSYALSEIKILHQLNHDRIIKLFGFYMDQHKIIIFMEAMEGSVKDEINEKKHLSELEAMHYFTQAAEGLAHLHSRKPKAIIHRDIKCENLLLTAEKNVKLADFGLAVDLTINSASKSNPSTAPTSFAGTYLFIAPEVTRNMSEPKVYGRKSDIWSLACTLVQMIDGKPPHKEIGFYDFVERSSNISTNPLKYSDELLPEASNAIKRLLNSMFITDFSLRPNAEDVLNLAHNATKAIKVEEAAEAAEARNLGDMHYNGRGVPQSYEEAFKWCRKAAEQGHGSAQFYLGVMYENGHGVPQSDEEAVVWYKKAAEQGDANGQFLLGNMYQNGRGVPQSFEEAVKWYRKAAEQGYASAQSNLGFMYQNGHGVPQSDEEAVVWYKKAAEQGDLAAQNNLQSISRKGGVF